VSKSRFSGLADVLKKPKPSEEKKVAKSKDRDHYAQTTVYLARDMYGDLQKALTDEKREYSQLVEDLLREWLKNRKRSDV
jgi:hypothetical protein